MKKPKAVVQSLTGLDLTLNLETEYSTLNTYALEQNVAYLAVHDREQVPSGRWTTYSPGFSYDLTLKIKEFQRLPAPYRVSEQLASMEKSKWIPPSISHHGPAVFGEQWVNQWYWVSQGATKVNYNPF